MTKGRCPIASVLRRRGQTLFTWHQDESSKVRLEENKNEEAKKDGEQKCISWREGHLSVYPHTADLVMPFDDCLGFVPLFTHKKDN